MNTKKEERPWVSRLLSLLFSQNELHVPSKKLKNYRCKITYNLPLETTILSPLADLHLNEVCQTINDWIKEHEKDKLFREVMAKCSRDGAILVRVTVQKSNYDANGLVDDSTTADCIGKDNYKYDWNEDVKQNFVSHLTKFFPAITCICYNETFNRSTPTKNDPVHLLYGDAIYLLEQTRSGLSYQIGPDTFCEVNHEVEHLQQQQKVSWIKEYQGAILICSGRDISSFALGYGSILNDEGEKVFSEVIAVQHCPLVNKDAVANFQRHKDEVQVTVLCLNKDEMGVGVSRVLNAALERRNHPPVVVVTTGGRKGLNPHYVNFLKDHKSVQCIIYNSCSTKSLEVDMEGFLSGPDGYCIDDFRSYDFLAGTKYTSSVLRLLRRPRTLVLPIGPAGVGKSTLAKTLMEKSPSRACSWWHRDLEFAKLRNANMSMLKTKSLVHEKMIAFLEVNDEHDKSVRIVDSTNGNAGARLLYVQEAKPDILIFVVLSPGCSTTAHDKVVDSLLSRTQNRLEGGNESHPSFPNTVDQQRKKHVAILKGIEYPTVNEFAGIGIEARKVLFHCNPLEEVGGREILGLSSLPFEIFLEYAASSSLNQKWLSSADGTFKQAVG